MAVIRGFRDLIVYRRAVREANEVFALTQGFPHEERFALTDQIRRASRAVGALLAEAWARRRYRAAFINKVNEALGEAMETQAWLDHAITCKYIAREQYKLRDAEWQEIGAMLNGMIDRADDLCKPQN